MPPTQASTTDPDTQQLNVRLPAELIRRLKHAAVAEEATMTALVQRLLVESLERLDIGQLDEAASQTQSRG